MLTQLTAWVLRAIAALLPIIDHARATISPVAAEDSLVSAGDRQTRPRSLRLDLESKRGL